MKKNRKCMGCILAAIIGMQILGGCVVQQKSEKVADLEFTVEKNRNLPKTLQEQLEEKKEEAFSLTYSDNEYLYIAKGYGQQETGGYSISVDECYLTENTICVATTLHGPKAGENVPKSPSYPIIVLKTELREEQVRYL